MESYVVRALTDFDKENLRTVDKYLRQIDKYSFRISFLYGVIIIIAAFLSTVAYRAHLQVKKILEGAPAQVSTQNPNSLLVDMSMALGGIGVLILVSLAVGGLLHILYRKRKRDKAIFEFQHYLTSASVRESLRKLYEYEKVTEIYREFDPLLTRLSML